MWSIAGRKKGEIFPDMARDKDLRQLDFKDYSDAVNYAEENEYIEYSIVLTSQTNKLARKTMGCKKV